MAASAVNFAYIAALLKRAEPSIGVCGESGLTLTAIRIGNITIEIITESGETEVSIRELAGTVVQDTEILSCISATTHPWSFQPVM